MLDEVLKVTPPLLHRWFLGKFTEPAAWMNARLAYTRTAAVWSMVGHVVGLGDRHGENILVRRWRGKGWLAWRGMSGCWSMPTQSETALPPARLERTGVPKSQLPLPTHPLCSWTAPTAMWCMSTSPAFSTRA